MAGSLTFIDIVVKGLNAMEYPPYQVESTRLRSSGSLSVPDPGGKPLPEKIPLEAHRAGLRSYHVHFDLDPQNGMFFIFLPQVFTGLRN